ncbi:MAG: hypothetical protein COT90_01980 [Candidatus Diapherotrites archaeon CG10_big_fil_rev_8_21_14_0_10_31_34]|nr:MAG: hypothetical protein COT90_01980 [Candidatus Diapherotrites archaeon CG10_big_fil_rev_8_21_14_0_10_31_34]
MVYFSNGQKKAVKGESKHPQLQAKAKDKIRKMPEVIEEIKLAVYSRFGKEYRQEIFAAFAKEFSAQDFFEIFEAMPITKQKEFIRELHMRSGAIHIKMYNFLMSNYKTIEADLDWLKKNKKYLKALYEVSKLGVIQSENEIGVSAGMLKTLNDKNFLWKEENYKYYGVKKKRKRRKKPLRIYYELSSYGEWLLEKIPK